MSAAPQFSLPGRQLELVGPSPSPLPSPSPRPLSLRAHIDTVDALAEAIERLDDEALDPAQHEAIAEQLVDAIGGTRGKVDRTCCVLAMFEHLEAAAKAEEDRLAKRAAYFHRQRERLEKYVLGIMASAELPRIDGETASLQRKLNPPGVVIDDANAIPWEFMRLPEAPPPPDAVPDKKAIAAALKADPASVPGCRLNQTARLVRS